MDYEQIADGLLAEAEGLKALKGKKLSVALVLPLALKTVEVYAAGKSLSSKDKREIAKAVIVKALAASGKVPDLDQIVMLVNLAIGLSNSLFGKKWLAKTN